VAGCRAELSEPVRAIQRSLGRDMTVWGVKWDGARLFWELYFYDPQREDASARLGALTQTVKPWLSFVPVIPDSIPYMMASFELSAELTRSGTITHANLYLTGEEAHAGRSYRVTTGEPELENTYRFLEAKRQSAAIVTLLKSSAFVDYGEPSTLSKVLVPELFACKKICVAKKRTHDGIYYSGITGEQLAWFLRRFAYPPPLTDFLQAHQAEFSHLYFDVGFDYRSERATGGLVFPKSSFYGTL
jgi:hypothetical protein